MKNKIDVESEINELLEFKEYIINDKKIDAKAKEKAKEKYNINFKKWLTKNNYIITGVGHHIEKLLSVDTEKLYNSLLMTPEYDLCNLRLILNSSKLMKKPYQNMLKYLPKFLYSLIPTLLTFSFVDKLSDNFDWKKNVLLATIYADRFYIILGISISLPIAILVKEFFLPIVNLKLDYIISIIDDVKKSSGKDDGNKDLINNNNNVESEDIEVIKTTENKTRKETLTIKLKNKKAPVENN